MDFSFSLEQESFVEAARGFARTRVAPRAAAIDAEAAFPRDLVDEAGALGLTGVAVASAHGGAGRDAVTYALAMEAVAYASATLAVALIVNQSLVAEPIQEFGTDAQRAEWLPRLASGRSVGAFALSEEQSGSDAANQQTVARSAGSGYVLSGRKVWVANATAADVAVVFAATAPETPRRGITAFLVRLDAPGLTRQACDSLGVRGLGCMDLTLDDVRVSESDILGRAGDGFRVALRALEGGRIAIGAQALGVGQAALDEALAYTRRREAFGQTIGHFQAIQFQLADLATDLEAARVLVWKAADTRDRSGHAACEAAMAKLQASEAAHRAADRAMQILASAGYRRGSVVERLFRDARAAEIYQGTSEVQRLVIAKALLEAEHGSDETPDDDPPAA